MSPLIDFIMLNTFTICQNLAEVNVFEIYAKIYGQTPLFYFSNGSHVFNGTKIKAKLCAEYPKELTYKVGSKSIQVFQKTTTTTDNDDGCQVMVRLAYKKLYCAECQN